jgi:tonB-dependent receptor
LKAINLGVHFNNVFNRHYAASGWVYSAYRKATDLDTDPRYYQIGFVPMAGFNMMGNITLTF